MSINAVVALLVFSAGALLLLSLSLGFYAHSLRKPGMRYREMFQRSREGLFVIRVGQDGQFFLEEMNGVAASAIPPIHSGQSLSAIVDDFDVDHKRFLIDLRESLQQAVRFGRAAEYESSFWHNGEHRLVTYAVRLLPQDGERVGHVLGFMRDISEYKQIEGLLAVRTQDFRSVIENSPDTIARYDRECHRIYANQPFKHLAVSSARSHSRLETQEYCGARYREKLQEVISSGIDEEFECAWTNAAGRPMTSHIRIVPERDKSGQISGVLSIGRDIGTLKETEHHLRESRALLRELTARREMTAERMYRDIAQEIHEDLGQSLSAIRIKLALLQMRYGNSEPEGSRKVGETIGLLDHTIARMREMVTAIHPSVLNMGVSAALEWLAADALADTDIEYEIRMPSPLDEMDKVTTGVVFKIVQLALSNVVRHAEAQHVAISLDKQHGSYQLEVRDNGKGFDLDQSRKYSLGLVEMEELSHRLHGEIVFLSEPGKGTVIEVRFPAIAVLQPAQLEAV